MAHRHGRSRSTTVACDTLTSQRKRCDAMVGVGNDTGSVSALRPWHLITSVAFSGAETVGAELVACVTRQYNTDIVTTTIVVGRLNKPIGGSVDSFRFGHCTQDGLL